MNEWLKKLFGQIKGLWAKWTLIQKIILIGIVVAAGVGIWAIMSFSASPSMVPLFDVPVTDVAMRDKIIYRLNEENVATSVNTAGVIMVSDSVTARRMRSVLIRDDLIPGNTDPWALFDVERWTTTQFLNDVNLRRSITQMLTEHIESLDDVDRANLVITMPERTLFTADQNPVTASLVIYSKPGSDISTNRKKIEGIQKLIRAGVEGLRDENIVISDAQGTILNDFEGMAAMDRVSIIEQQTKLIEKLEARYRSKILASLQSTFGIDRVRDLNIKINMDMSERTIEGEKYSPIVVRPDNPDTPYDDSEFKDSFTLSSETATTRWQGTGFNPEGPAGVTGQTAPVYQDMSNLYGLSEQSIVKSNQVINSEKYQETRSPSIDRVTVSVNIDGEWQKKYNEKGELEVLPNGTIARDYVPIEAGILAEAQKLVQDAIGYDRARGDSVTVQNIRFDRSAQFAAEDESFLRAKQTQTTIIMVLVGIAVLLSAFIIFRLISREVERRRRLYEEEQLRKHQMEREKTLWEAEQAGMEVSMSVEERKRLELQENAITMAKEHPEDVALLIRTWLVEE